ncbi:adaptin N terminal region-domain-containing protein [Aspergillus avenaceus]|uniref:AP-3 complex subunit delta n=1 Tax=Aspergillus avenaceus TaxID=36643 RepID=A0A5N6TMR0_ASPAV|nr:adaptin N terminal region-domain-containing protein [Aspergillus avenaceus]
MYLEMFGYDMSWASFHVLEVMSSAKYLQKRVGYLAAVQSFRPDTEVLMLATNLLKKDLVSANVPNMSLPLITLPNIITPSLAMALLPDVLSRLSHSHAATRKKAVVCLYRLALVYPEALKLAWPKLKERLMDDEEDSSVTTAVINVVCELGWRRPHDFLPLAPRLFDLLVEGGNNWMAIKIIKLFATLTPLEPRLVRKLLRPLMNIIQTTTAMSLLYECINGIIQGGILDSDEGLEEKHEIAGLCVGKLRGMVVADSDPNLKYVALLAFSRIVISHPNLVAKHQDVIMDCLDDPDISIRLRALDLVARMVTSETLQPVVNQLLGQLSAADQVTRSNHVAESVGTSSYTDLEVIASQKGPGVFKDSSPLPDDYKLEVVHRILDICSYNNYSELPDFEWYVDVLVQLVKLLPPSTDAYDSMYNASRDLEIGYGDSVAFRIGSEIRNVAVRVKEVRTEATRAAESLILGEGKQVSRITPKQTNDVLGPLSWVVGEFAEHLASPSLTLHSLIDTPNVSLSANTLSLYIQAIPKVLANIICDSGESWGTLKHSELALLLAQIVDFFDALAPHPDLNVQERAIEFLEIMRLAADSVQTGAQEPGHLPFLLSSMIPSLFCGLELNPVAANAQRKVPLPPHLSLDRAFNNNLYTLFYQHVQRFPEPTSQLPSQWFYMAKDVTAPERPNIESIPMELQSSTTYQHATDGLRGDYSAPKRTVDRKLRNKDDPFYIGADDELSGISTPLHQAFNASSGGGVDVDSIPIIDLKLNEGRQHISTHVSRRTRKPTSHPRKYDIATDEMIGQEESKKAETTGELSKAKQSLLQVDSSGLEHISLAGKNGASAPHLDSTQVVEHDTEMARAVQEVEKVRLEMQRASERVHPKGIPAEGTLVKKKRKKAKKPIPTGKQETGQLHAKDELVANHNTD